MLMCILRIDLSRYSLSQHRTVRVYSQIMKTRNSIKENSGRRFPDLWEEKVYRSPRQLRNQNTSDVN